MDEQDAYEDLANSIMRGKVGLTATELYSRFPQDRILSWFQRLPKLLLYAYEPGHGQSWHACRFALAFPIDDEASYQRFAEALGIPLPWAGVLALDEDGRCTYSAAPTTFVDVRTGLPRPVIPLRIRGYVHAAFEQELLGEDRLGDRTFALALAFHRAARGNGYTPVIPPFSDKRTATAARLKDDLHPDRIEA
jgi:hypothetical protein